MTAAGRRPAGGGFSVLDAAAMAAGTAIAAVQFRDALRDQPTGPGSVVVWGAFAWVALTAAGPFVYGLRRHARRLPDYPRMGDRLWAILGLPWLLSSALLASRHAAAGAGAGPPNDATAAVGLTVGLGVASMIVLAIVWKTWVMVAPDQASETFSASWTNRVGLVLAVAWPVQCGVGMVVLG